MREDLSGYYAAVVTPFTRGGERVDYGLIGPLMARMSDAGLDGLLLLGSTGEWPSMTMDEKMLVIDEAASTREDLRLIVGISSLALPESLALLSRAAAKGADAALVLPPFYYSSGSRGERDFFSRILAASEIPIIAYNVPSHTHRRLSPGLISHLRSFETFWGIKDSSGDIDETKRFIDATDGGVLIGSVGTLLEGIENGAAGGILAIGNILPNLLAAFGNSTSRGDMEAAAATMIRAREELRRHEAIPAIKAVLSRTGLPRTYSRLPLTDLTEEETSDLVSALEARDIPLRANHT